MTEEKGWISLHRKFIDWEWYDDANVMRVFIHLLLCANHKDNKWRGILIRRGQLVTSLSKLADSLKLSKMQIRNTLTKLKTTHEITHLATREYSIISIKNYDMYQEVTHRTTHEQHSKQHTSNTRATLNNNDNNININSSSSSSINVQAKSKKVQNDINLTEEEEELLINLSKRNGVKYFDLWLEKLVQKGHLEKRLQEEKEKAERKRAIQARFLEEKKQEEQIPDLTEEERQQALEKARELAGINNKRRSKK